MTDMMLSHDMRGALAERSSYELPESGLVFFGIRGLLPLDLSDTDFAAAHGVRLIVHDYLHMRCTIGQWQPGCARAFRRFLASLGKGVSRMAACRPQSQGHDSNRQRPRELHRLRLYGRPRLKLDGAGGGPVALCRVGLGARARCIVESGLR